MNVLLTPARIGHVEIKNRIVMAPMTTRLADEDGFVTEHTVNYYMARVRGGTGLITVEMASPTRAGRHRRRSLHRRRRRRSRRHHNHGRRRRRHRHQADELRADALHSRSRRGLPRSCH